MSDTANPATLDTAVLESCRERFENAWRSRPTEQEPPRWQQFLPASSEPCSPKLISLLLCIDIEFRAKAGLPSLLTERYFEHPRLQEDDALLDAEGQLEVIRWDYQQRWKNGQQARRIEYEAAFPEHSEALRELKPRSTCPECQKLFVLEESLQPFVCPECKSSSIPPPQWDERGYEMMEKLGGGGMGEVYRSSDPALERNLAIKVIKAEHLGKPEYERRFLREARITGSLQHPGIVSVHNLGRLPDGRLHYTMRLVRGRTFEEILKEEADKPARLPSLLGIFEKICQAVAYAHSKRVIHRDLKPSNVMVGRFGEVQVMDWGLAKLMTPDETTPVSEKTPDVTGTRIRTEPAGTPVGRTIGPGFGSPPYMPPEQARGKWKKVDERADVFALGSILCEILTQQPAYTGQTREEVEEKAEQGDLSEALGRLEECGADAALLALCRECLAPAREDRPRDAKAVSDRVAAYQAEVQERLRQAELERVAAETRAQEEKARVEMEQERTRDALLRVKAERRAKRRMLALAALLLKGMLALAAGIVIVNSQKRLTEDALKAEARRKKQARDVLDAMTSSLIGDLLAKQPELTDTQRQFLRTALQKYEEFAADTGEDEEIRAGVARAYQQVGAIRRKLEENEHAEAALKTSAALFAGLAESFSSTEGYRQELAGSHLELGLLLYHLGRDDEAEKEYRASRSILEGLYKQFPEKPANGKLLGRSHNNLGILLLKRGWYDGAEKEFAAALSIQKGLAAEFPDVVGYRQDLAVTHGNLGLLFAKKLGRADEATEEYRAAIEIQERLVEQFPKNATYQRDLATNHLGLGRLQSVVLKRDDEGLKEYEAALRLYALVAIQFPAVIQHRAELGYAHENLGAVLFSLRRHQEAEKEFLAAYQIKQGLVDLFPDVPDYRRDLGYSHNNLGGMYAQLGNYDAAEKHYRMAIRLKEDLVKQSRDSPSATMELGNSYNAFGTFWLTRNRLDEAQVWYDKAIAILQPVYETHRLADASHYLCVAHAGRGQVLNGLGRPAEAARLYADAFTADFKLATSHTLYNAACSAALAAAGQGKDCRLLPDRVAAMFRRWALTWLRDNLTAYTKLAGQSNGALKQEIQRLLTYWRSDSDLASVRDQPALDRLPEYERAAWQALWRDVDELMNRVTTKSAVEKTDAAKDATKK